MAKRTRKSEHFTALPAGYYDGRERLASGDEPKRIEGGVWRRAADYDDERLVAGRPPAASLFDDPEDI